MQLHAQDLAAYAAGVQKYPLGYVVGSSEQASYETARSSKRTRRLSLSLGALEVLVHARGNICFNVV